MEEERGIFVEGKFVVFEYVVVDVTARHCRRGLILIVECGFIVGRAECRMDASFERVTFLYTQHQNNNTFFCPRPFRSVSAIAFVFIVDQTLLARRRASARRQAVFVLNMSSSSQPTESSPPTPMPPPALELFPASLAAMDAAMKSVTTSVNKARTLEQHELTPRKIKNALQAVDGAAKEIRSAAEEMATRAVDECPEVSVTMSCLTITGEELSCETSTVSLKQLIGTGTGIKFPTISRHFPNDISKQKRCSITTERHWARHW